MIPVSMHNLQSYTYAFCKALAYPCGALLLLHALPCRAPE